MRKPMPDKALLDELKRLNTLLGKPAGESAIKKLGKYSLTLYSKRYGSLNLARKKAGLPTVQPTPKISNTALLAELHRLQKMLRKIPTGKDIKKHGKYSWKRYGKRFGGLKNARLKAVLEAAARISKKELLDEYKRLFNLLGKMPSARDINKHGKYGTSTYFRHFGNLKNIRKKANIHEKS